MALTVAQLAVKVSADTAQAQTGLLGIAEMLGPSGLIAAGALGTVAAVAGIGLAAAHMAGDFQEGMTQLVTGAGEAKSNIDLVSKGILQMAVDTGTTTQQLTAGMYMIESAGYHGKAGLEVLKAAAEGAKVGNADLGVVADATTTILNDFGSSGVTASQAVNGLVATVANGKTHMQDLAGAMASVLPTAAAYKVHLNDVEGALATMTAAGVPAADAATYLRQTLIGLGSPTAGAAKALKEVGMTTEQVNESMKKSLPETLAMITEAVGKKFPEGSVQYNEAIKAIAGGSKQMQGMLDLTGDHLKTFHADVGLVSDAVKQGGKSIQGWSDVQGDFNFKIARAKEGFETMMISLGTKLLPVLGQLVDWFTAHLVPALQFVVDHFDLVTGAVGKLVEPLQGLGAAIGAALGPVATQVQTHTAKMKVDMLANTEAMQKGAIADTIKMRDGILAAIDQTTDPAKRHMLEMKLEVTTHTLEMQEKSVKHTEQLKVQATAHLKELHETGAQHLLGLAQHAGTTFGSFVGPTMKDALAAVQKFGGELAVRLGPAATNIMIALAQVFTGVQIALRFLQDRWNDAWPAMSAVLTGVWDIIKGFVMSAWAFVSGIIKVGLDLLGGNWKQAWQDIKEMFFGIWDGIKLQLIGVLKILGGLLLDFLSGVLGLLAKIPGPVGDMARQALKGVQDVASQLRGLGEQAGGAYAAGLASQQSIVADAAARLNRAATSGGGKASAHALGGVTGRGISLVGEQGPELAIFPEGTRIIPAGQTAAMLSGGSAVTPLSSNGGGFGGTQHIIIQLDRRTLAEAVVREMPSVVRLGTGLAV